MTTALKNQAPAIATVEVTANGIDARYTLRTDGTILVRRKAHGMWQPWKAISSVDIDPIYTAEDLTEYATNRWPMAAIRTILHHA
jgi:hypothetical protein